MRSLLNRRINGYRKLIAHKCWMWRTQKDIARNFSLYDAWLGRLQKCPPDVYIGSDLKSGGVRGHLHAIQAYSSLNIELVPNESIMGQLDRFDVHVLKRFMAFFPENKPVVHSHVLPWMIHWCHRQQERGLRWVHTHHNWYYPEFAKDKHRLTRTMGLFRSGRGCIRL